MLDCSDLRQVGVIFELKKLDIMQFSQNFSLRNSLLKGKWQTTWCKNWSSLRTSGCHSFIIRTKSLLNPLRSPQMRFRFYSNCIQTQQLTMFSITRRTKPLHFALLKIRIQMLLFWLSLDIHTNNFDIIAHQEIPVGAGQFLFLF